MSGPGRIGAVARRGDTIRRARGEIRYTADLHLPRMLHAKLLRSPYPHARIVRIDAARALALPGVAAVLTGEDLPARFGIIPWTPDEYALAVHKARFVGDAVAAVAARDERTADEACRAHRCDVRGPPGGHRSRRPPSPSPRSASARSPATT